MAYDERAVTRAAAPLENGGGKFTILLRKAKQRTVEELGAEPCPALFPTILLVSGGIGLNDWDRVSAEAKLDLLRVPLALFGLHKYLPSTFALYYRMLKNLEDDKRTDPLLKTIYSDLVSNGPVSRAGLSNPKRISTDVIHQTAQELANFTLEQLIEQSGEIHEILETYLHTVPEPSKSAIRRRTSS